VLKTSGPLAAHASSVVLPFLLPDTPVVAWWPGAAPEVPAQDPLGRLAIRRITDATAAREPARDATQPIDGLHPGRHRPGVESHHLLAGAARLRTRSAAVRTRDLGGGVRTGSRTGAGHPGRLAGRADRRTGPPPRPGDLKVELVQPSSDHHVESPAGWIHRHAEPHRPAAALLPLARRETKECLAEDLRRLDADEIYREALGGIDKVQYAASGERLTVADSRVVIETYPDTDAPAAAAATHGGRHRSRHRCPRTRPIVLTGGGTGIGMLKRLRGNPVDWSRVHLFWAMTGSFLMTTPSATKKQAREALIDHVGIPACNVHAMAPSDGAYDGDLSAAAAGMRLCSPTSPRMARPHHISTFICSAWAARGTSTRCSRTPPPSGKLLRRRRCRRHSPSRRRRADHPHPSGDPQLPRGVAGGVRGRGRPTPSPRSGWREAGRHPGSRRADGTESTVWLIDDAAAAKLRQPDCRG